MNMPVQTATPSSSLAAAAKPPGGGPSPAAWAKGALRRLAQAQQEPTPENYARAYAEEAGVLAQDSGLAAEPVKPGPGAALPQAASDAAATAATAATAAADNNAWALVVARIVRHLDRPGQQWTPARRKDSLQRVLAGSRSDATRLLQRLQGLTTAWETDQPAESMDLALDAPASVPTTATVVSVGTPAVLDVAGAAVGAGVWSEAAQALHSTVQAGLPASDPRAAPLATELADNLAALADAIAQGHPLDALLQQLQALCKQAQSLFAHRQHLVDELSALCRELAAGLTDLVEDDSWARGQCASLQARLYPAGSAVPAGQDAVPGASGQADGLSVRSVRAATELLSETRSRQHQVRQERREAQTAIKTLIQRMIGEAGELGDQAGRYQQSLGQHAQAIASADSLHSLAGVVRAMLDDNQAVQRAVGATRERLHDDQAQAQALQARVRDLESQLRKLSDEVATDALTQVANRRGLGQAFEALVGPSPDAKSGTATTGLAVGLLDIDNFKRLNDSLGHAAGDQALKALAAAVRERLRPVDHIARFGGEEFVVLLPGTPLAEAQQALSRLQRSLSAGLFMHEGKDVLVTFSAGVTAWRSGESLEAALERADQALYEAKRTGKNRTCMA